MRILSADSHTVEPGDLWTSRLDRKFRDNAPHIEMQGSTALLIAPGIRPFAVQRLTSEPADYFGIRTRGRLLPGLAADITIFDYDRVMPGPVVMLSDLPGGGRRLVQEARGIQYTIVNGQVVYENGKPTGALPGAVLRSGNC
jgi:cytosine/adenosine deaminase-related metal-dependent hydrolase